MESIAAEKIDALPVSATNSEPV
ncbi:hypothetical protein CCACVL1_28949 [Corchorus capsularis]|uniref:Uncharacterized protein n=1 Tax=Corchorus capsularis TaxID=210143 RepID=A0A1R3G4K4_COCAP|nr:hypothetical protein CCACVL1_28949 [Corchorus capsularis]